THTHTSCCCILFCTATATPASYTLSLHDALPIFGDRLAIDLERRLLDRGERRYAGQPLRVFEADAAAHGIEAAGVEAEQRHPVPDRKSTRLNSSHLGISYAVFCLKKKSHHTGRAG